MQFFPPRWGFQDWLNYEAAMRNAARAYELAQADAQKAWEAARDRQNADHDHAARAAIAQQAMFAGDA